MTDYCTSVLVDARNFDALFDELIGLVASSEQVAFDIETYDEPHAGIARARGKNSRKVIFDSNRTFVAGFSICCSAEQSRAFYFNLSHADVANRIPWAKARKILDARSPTAWTICHNAQFEIVMMRKALGYELGPNVICSMQLCATLYNPDTYPIQSLNSLGAMKPVIDRAVSLFSGYEGKDMTPEQADLYFQLMGKQSKAAHSWNGHVKTIAYGFGLKQAVKSWFGVQMQTFEETLGGKEHMGELTGNEVAAYGADDSFWALQLTILMLTIYADRTGALQAFFETENPMVSVYADVWAVGLRVNYDAIAAQRLLERDKFAAALKKLQGNIRALLPFKDELSPPLLKQDWYANGAAKYRQKIADWALKDHDDIVASVPGSTSSSFGVQNKTGPNFSHYMPVRVLLYDLMGLKALYVKGKMASDDDAREALLNRTEEGTPERGVLLALNDIAKIEQRLKLFIAPYLDLTDPETHRMYSSLQSLLATRRTSSENPNTQQLAKRGESVFVRGFFLPDNDEHVIVSIDWSQIELVLIGEKSGDPEFARAYAQKPYRDLHIGATVDCLSVLVPEITESMFVGLKSGKINDVPDALLTFSGKKMEPAKAYKFWRTEVGKAANFGYCYSGALSAMGEKLGWTSEQMWEATERYRTRFATMEQWRLDTIDRGRAQGYIELPDGTRRDRIELTPAWADQFRAIVRANYGVVRTGAHALCDKMIRDIQRRAGNQLVNAEIQGTCAILAKRSILRILDEIRNSGFDARFMTLIHDELVFSVRRTEAVQFIKVAKEIMCDHPDLVKNLVIDCSASVGRTFEPYNSKSAPFGQIELDEAPDGLTFIPSSMVGQKMNDNEILETLEYLRIA